MSIDIKNIKLPVYKVNSIMRGVVEDNNDPEKMGRVKVRVYGMHTNEKTISETEGILTSDLPWASPATSIYGGTSKIGQFGVPCQGANVFVFFEYGNPMMPVYFATAPGVPSNRIEKDEGFNDPAGKYPEIMCESDWCEGENSTSEYPHNFVLARTKCGHIIELDDTEGNERIIIRHGKTGAMIEFTPEGDIKNVTKEGANTTEYARGTKNIYVKDDFNIDVGKTFTQIIKDKDETITSSKTSKVLGAKNEEVVATVTEKYGEQNTNVNNSYNIVTGGKFNLESGDDIQIRTKTSDIRIHTRNPLKKIDINSYNEVAIEGKQKVNIKSPMQVNIKSNMIVDVKTDMILQTKSGLMTKMDSDLFTMINANVLVKISGGVVIIG